MTVDLDNSYCGDNMIDKASLPFRSLYSIKEKSYSDNYSTNNKAPYRNSNRTYRI